MDELLQTINGVQDATMLLDDAEFMARVLALGVGQRQRLREAMKSRGRIRASDFDAALKVAARAAKVPPQPASPYDVDADPIAVLRALRPDNRHIVLAPEHLPLLVAMMSDDPPAFEELVTAWRTAKVPDVKGLVDHIRRQLKAQEQAAEDESAILAGGPDVNTFVTQVQNAILDQMPDAVFVRSGDLVRLRTIQVGDPETDETSLMLKPGTTVIHPVLPEWLSVKMSAAGIRFYRMTDRGPRDSRAPVADLRYLLAVSEDTRFPLLRGVSMVPTLTRNEPGYDASTQMYLAFPEGAFPPAPLHPSRQEAMKALARLRAPFAEYTFVSDADRSVAISMMLASVVRSAMRTCPMHAFRASVMGGGKTKFNNIAGVMATGDGPAHIAFSDRDEENEKRLTTALMYGTPVISIDNVGRGVPVTGVFLCQMLTENPVSTRVLGEHRRALLDTTSLVVVNGNNLTIRDDVTRRSVRCRIDTGGVDPKTAVHSFDPVDMVKEHRAQLVVDCLTVVRAWVEAERPLPDGYRQMPSFADYDLIRGPLLWLGEADPAITQQGLFEEDEDFHRRADVLQALQECFGDAEFTSKDVVADLQGDAHEAMQRTLMGHVRTFNAITVGTLLGTFADQPTGPFILRRTVDAHTTKNLWRVMPTIDAMEDF